MNKNGKFLFVGLTLLLLLVSVGSITAADNDSTTTILSDNVESANHDTITSNTEKIVETSQKLETKDVKKTNKNLTKKTTQTDKQTKKADALQQTVNNYNELKDAWNYIQDQGDNETIYTINVKKGQYKFEDQLTSTKTSNAKYITINGENVDNTIFDGQNTTRFFNLNNTNQIIKINNITFKNGFNETQAGAIYVNSTTTLNNTKFINNVVNIANGTANGGAIYARASMDVYNSSFINNTIKCDNDNATSFWAYGCALSSNGGSLVTFNIELCEFINNNATSLVNISNQGCMGGAIYNTGRGIINIKNCDFFNNSAKTGAAINIGYTWGKASSSVLSCVFANNTATSDPNISSSSSLKLTSGSNYYLDNSDVSNIYIQTNGKPSNYTFNQKTKQLRISCLIDTDLYFGYITSLGRGYSLNLTSSSDLINTTGIKFTPENNYSVLFNVSNLPANHENITLYVSGIEATHITYDHTNVVFNNITAKPGNTITLKSSFTTSDGIIIPNGKVAFKINGKTVGHSNIKYGTATLNYTIPDNYSAKDYILTTTYGGSNKFIEARTNATLHLEKLATKTNLTTKIDGNTLKITVDPRDENGNTVKDGKICVKIEGKTLQNLKITGKTQVNFTIPKSWNNREIKILAIYGENNNHKQSRMEIKTKLTLNTKTTKTDTTVNNYYVSANSGSDTNTGSQSSPFKTIQKAIATVNSNKQNANIYLDGVFKGVGNTNLTVPGDLHINFIGVGNSSIDGEVNYTMKTTLEEGEYYWGSSPEWYPYNNGKGNWAMNITKGNGLITINNLTIKNCWNKGGSDISLYETATVDNYGNLEVNNVSFIFNHGGVGASIRNNNGANINVTNSLFEANRKSSSTGNYGAGIYNNGTATIINSTFQKNYARWGTITNDKQLTIINSTIRDNIAYDGSSTYKTGSGITINTGSTNFYEQNNSTDKITTIIDGCTFTNNDQLDIYADTGVTTIKNNIFNKSTGINSFNGNQNITFNFINNTFDSPIGSSIYTSLSSSNKYTFTLLANGKYKYNINSNTVINLTGTLSKALEATCSNSNIINNNFPRMIIISGENNIITGNNITTTMDQYTISLGDYKNNIVTNNNLIAAALKGNSAVNYTAVSNKVENNTPTVTELQIDDETFYKFFDDDGNLLDTYNNVEQIQIIGSLTNKNININQKISLFQKGRFVSYNITITTNQMSEISSLNITNINNQPVIILNGDNSIVKTSNLTTNNNYTIIANSKNNNITQNKLLADILVGDESVKTDKTNTIENNTPVYKNYILSEENFNTYFNNDGTIKDIPVSEVHFLVNGTIQNKNIILNNNKPIIITNYKDAKLVNTSIKTVENTTLDISYITIRNTDKITFDLTSKENSISNCNITSNTTILNAINTTTLTITRNNITTQTKQDLTLINIINLTTLNINYNNIQSKATENIKIINIEDATKTNLKYNNITTQSNTTAQPVKILNHEKIVYQVSNDIFSNNIIVNATNTIGLEIENQYITGRISYNEITLFGDKNIGMKLINVTRNNEYSSTLYDNDITLNSANSKAVVFEKMNDLYGGDLNYNRFYLNNNNSTAIFINQIANLTIQNNNKISMNGSDDIAIYSNNSNLIKIIGSNIQSLTNTNDNIAPIILNNTTGANITKNNITTTSKYTIIINEPSNNNQIIDNNLYADNNLADNSILNPNPDTNKVLNNNPEITTYYYLNEKTYNQFFDENGNLRDEIPAGLKIIATGNLENKKLNINKPLNIIADGIIYTNTIVNLTPEASNITLRGLTITGDSQLIIGSNNSNINISSMNCYKDDNNKTILIINGNNNNITTGSIYSSSNVELNITVIEITGNNNYVHFTGVTSTSSKYDKIIGILLNNANNNIIDHTSAVWIEGLNTTPLLLNNSNNNTIFTNQLDLEQSEYNEGIILVNSSYNKFRGRIGTYNIKINTISSLLKVENNSNFNNFEGLSLDGRHVTKTPIYITNSHYNIFRGQDYEFNELLGYAINITEGVGNNITYNYIETATLEGNDAVIQENKNDTINNMVMYNYAKSVKSTVLNIIMPDTIKVYDNVRINISVSYRNGTNWDSPYVPVETGHAIFEVNGKQIGTVEVVNGLAEINYTIQPEDGKTLTVKVSYEDPTLKYDFISETTTKTIELLDSKVIMANTTNTGVNSKVTAIILDEKGNIIYDGNVTFTLGNVNQTVTISNGIAQVTFDTSAYKLGKYNITATFNGNDICAVANNTVTLTVTKYDVNVQVNPITTLSGNKVLLTANVTDINGKAVNTGRVIFKLNGCTLKDSNGNTLYANVINGTATVEYMIPAHYTAKNYTLTAVASSNTYNRTETNSTLTINKTTPKAQQIPLKVKRTNNTTITVKFTDNENNDLIGENKVCIKFNGKTLINTKATNGTVKVNLDLTNYKNSQYEFTVICGANSRYNTCKNVSTLILE